MPGGVTGTAREGLPMSIAAWLRFVAVDTGPRSAACQRRRRGAERHMPAVPSGVQRSACRGRKLRAVWTLCNRGQVDVTESGNDDQLWAEIGCIRMAASNSAHPSNSSGDLTKPLRQGGPTMDCPSMPPFSRRTPSPLEAAAVSVWGCGAHADAPPCRRKTSARSRRPFCSIWSTGVRPSLSLALMSAPCLMSNSMISAPCCVSRNG